MSAQPSSDGPHLEPPQHTIAAEAGSRLEQLQAAYPAAKAEADEAAARLKAITDGIKLELTQSAPEERRIVLASSGASPAMHLTYTESWRVDTRKLKTEAPETYVQYAVKSGSWRLTAGGPHS